VDHQSEHQPAHLLQEEAHLWDLPQMARGVIEGLLVSTTLFKALAQKEHHQSVVGHQVVVQTVIWYLHQVQHQVNNNRRYSHLRYPIPLALQCLTRPERTIFSILQVHHKALLLHRPKYRNHKATIFALQVATRRADIPSVTIQTEEAAAKTPIDERTIAKRMIRTRVPPGLQVATCLLHAMDLRAARWTTATAVMTGLDTATSQTVVLARRSSTHRRRRPNCDRTPLHLTHSPVGGTTLDNHRKMEADGTNTGVASNSLADLVGVAVMAETTDLLAGRAMEDAMAGI